MDQALALPHLLPLLKRLHAAAPAGHGAGGMHYEAVRRRVDLCLFDLALDFSELAFLLLQFRLICLQFRSRLNGVGGPLKEASLLR